MKTMTLVLLLVIVLAACTPAATPAPTATPIPPTVTPIHQPQSQRTHPGQLIRRRLSQALLPGATVKVE